MLDVVHASMMHWYRLVGTASPGAQAFEPRPGVVAAVVPAAPERAVANAALYERPADLAAAYDEIAAAYEAIGATWTVWVQPAGREEAVGLLEERGHFLDSTPIAMARRLDDGGPGRPPPDALESWTAEGRVEDLTSINDRSYTFGTDSFARAFANFPTGAAQIYTARANGAEVACLVMTDHGANTEVQLVAVVPEARGRGLAGKLLSHALADAARRGMETATLMATKAGRPVYDRLGFEPLEEFQMWERPAARAVR